jgi:hypothetical protein
MLVVERSILHHWVDIDDTGTLLDDKLLLPGVFSGQSYSCFCFLIVRDNNEDVVTAIRCDHTDCSVSNDYSMILSFSNIDSSAITSSQYTGFRLH